jgi:hypothetical protein
MGAPPRSFAIDAHDCILVWTRTGSTEYKAVVRWLAPRRELPLGSNRLASTGGHRPIPTGSEERVLDRDSKMLEIKQIKSVI